MVCVSEVCVCERCVLCGGETERLVPVGGKASVGKVRSPPPTSLVQMKPEIQHGRSEATSAAASTIRPNNNSKSFANPH